MPKKLHANSINLSFDTETKSNIKKMNTKINPIPDNLASQLQKRLDLETPQNRPVTSDISPVSQLRNRKQPGLNPLTNSKIVSQKLKLASKFKNYQSCRHQVKSDDNTEILEDASNALDGIIPPNSVKKDDLFELRGLCLKKPGASSNTEIKYGQGINFDKIKNGNDLAIYTLNEAIVNHFIELYHKNTMASVTDKSNCLDLEFLAQTIDAGGNINTIDVYGQTLLHEVVRFWHSDVFKFFVERGANIYAEDAFGVSIFHAAAGNDRDDILEMLIKQLKLDCGDNTEEVIRILSAKTKNEQQTILHYAAKFDNTSCIRRILEEVPDMKNMKDFLNRTPLLLAAELDRSEAAKILLDEGSNPQLRDSDGQMCLVSLIDKMPKVANSALDYFVQTYRSQRIQKFHLYPLGPLKESFEGSSSTISTENSRASLVNLSENQFKGGLNYAMDMAIAKKCLSVLQHPVMTKLIDTKWENYGRKGAFMQLLMSIGLVVVWSIVAVVDKTTPYLYCWGRPVSIFRVIIYVFACLYNVWYIWQEIREFNLSRAKNTKENNFKKQWLDKRLEKEHPRWPDNKKYWVSERAKININTPLRVGGLTYGEIIPYFFSYFLIIFLWFFF